MTLDRIQPAALGRQTGPFVAGVRSGRFLFISGQVARNADGSIAGVGDARAQAIKVHENMKAVLDSVGATFADITKVTVYLTDLSHREVIQQVRREYFGKDEPASTMVQVAGLVHPDFLLEIEAIAEIPGAD